MRYTHRNLVGMFFLFFLTLGIYFFYWLVVTKDEFNSYGAKIPTAILYLIPIANIYFLYLFAQAFCQQVLKNEQKAILYFFLILLFPPAGMLIYQSYMNEATLKEGSIQP